MPYKYKREVTRTCPKCSVVFETIYPTKMYCSSVCQEKKRTMALRGEYLRLIHNYFGNKCGHCGFTDIRALQIDHVSGGGAKELKRKGGGIQHYRNVLSEIDSGKYQLLCANCNWIKRHENNEK